MYGVLATDLNKRGKKITIKINGVDNPNTTSLGKFYVSIGTTKTTFLGMAVMANSNSLMEPNVLNIDAFTVTASNTSPRENAEYDFDVHNIKINKGQKLFFQFPENYQIQLNKVIKCINPSKKYTSFKFNGCFATGNTILIESLTTLTTASTIKIKVLKIKFYQYSENKNFL